MNEDIIIFSLNLSLSLLLSLFLSLSLNVEPPWEGGGAILGTTPHPTMLLNIYMISLSIITMSIFITNHHSYHSSSSSSSLTLTLKPTTPFGDHNGESPFAKEVEEGYAAAMMCEKSNRRCATNDGSKMCTNG